jgi:opacity protein-like surface antigen
MNFRLILVASSFLLASELRAGSYGLFEAAYVEPEEGIVKSIYKSNTYALGLGYGKSFDNGSKLEAHIAHREYRSRLNALESNMRLYELGGDVVHVLSSIPGWFDFFIGAGVKVMFLDVAIEDETTDQSTTKSQSSSFAYQYQFGGEVPFPSLGSTFRLAIAREHIYKSAFGNFSLDGHLYKFIWTREI